ncbi:LAMI_0D00760g1_1 [Lachancea mirantina]|uniref:LAMI_0D00760g1_1 n=1 Tax=Lachancea mirantina TaxID=1230905 RepID=A0A1G4J8C0_9SACH|nr:LAMI_0D00760g1_1 [Lachancea mirantina]
MGFNFYETIKPQSDGVSERIVSSGSQYIPELKTETISTGNQISEVPTLTSWFHGIISASLSKVNLYKAEIETQKSSAANELRNAREYVSENILTDKYESTEFLVPACISAVGAFAAGRIISNPQNWGFRSTLNKIGGILARNPSFLGRTLTSIPSRLILPWALALTTFKFLIPVTSQNAVEALEKDFLPPAARDYHKQISKWYAETVQASAHNLSSTSQKWLQGSIHRMRKFVIDQLSL